MEEVEPTDLILRIALVDEELEELSPSIWRRFKVSSHVNLDLLHDKLIAPIMGWTRNYHGYYMRTLQGNARSITYLQAKIASVDMMCHSDGAWHNIDDIKAPESTTIGELLITPTDQMLYVYDLGDTWRHIVTLEQHITGPTVNGKVELLDGSMRCPDEDGGGCQQYQEGVLDVYCKLKRDPSNSEVALKLAKECHENRAVAANVRGPFRCDDFDLGIRRKVLYDTLRSRNSAYDSVKTFSFPNSFFGGGKSFGMARKGQRSVTSRYEHIHDGDNDPFSSGVMVTETINLQPDPKESSLCCNCGSPFGLKACVACKCARYCSVECQSSDWKFGHNKRCKEDRKLIAEYWTEESEGRNDCRSEFKGADNCFQKFDPNNLRMSVGDPVECRMGAGPNDMASGVIIATMYREQNWPKVKIAPYQVQLNKTERVRWGFPKDLPPSLFRVYTLWDDDYHIRRPIGVACSLLQNESCEC